MLVLALDLNQCRSFWLSFADLNFDQLDLIELAIFNCTYLDSSIYIWVFLAWLCGLWAFDQLDPIELAILGCTYSDFFSILNLDIGLDRNFADFGTRSY